MSDLNRDEIRAMGKAVGLTIDEPELTEVMHSLNALLEALDGLNPPGLDEVEPLPIILPHRLPVAALCGPLLRPRHPDDDSG